MPVNLLALFNEYVLPALTAGLTALPGLISQEAADVQAAEAAIAKAVTDFSSGFATIVSAAKAAKPPAA